MTWYLTGDTHGKVADRLKTMNLKTGDAVIILGDAGLNFYCNKVDLKEKQAVQELGIYVYCVRGNHDVRPESLPTIAIYHDPMVQGDVYTEPQFPNIRYFIDGEEYIINNYRCLVIGGAYSIDKEFRLSRAASNNQIWTGWFVDEQLSPEEQAAILPKIGGKVYDFVFTHTCPLEWQPRDLFIAAASNVEADTTMEKFLDDVRCNISYGVWCFGHYHADRLERPYVEQYYKLSDTLDNVWNRWVKYTENGKHFGLDDWYHPKSPNFYINFTHSEHF